MECLLLHCPPLAQAAMPATTCGQPLQAGWLRAACCAGRLLGYPSGPPRCPGRWCMLGCDLPPSAVPFLSDPAAAGRRVGSVKM